MTTKQQIPDIYTLEEIEKVTSQSSFAKDLMQGIRDGFVALEQGKFFACPIQTMGLPPFEFCNVPEYAAQTCVKSGYFQGHDYYVIKVASGGHPHPNSGLMQVYSQTTGRLQALLLDNGILTELRTAAVGALAACLLAPKKLRAIGMVGTGVQARYQLNMLLASLETDCRKLLVWGRSRENANALQEEMSGKGWSVSVVASTDEIMEACDLVITTTSAREAIVGSKKITERSTGMHITCIGSDAPGKMELDPTLVAKADLLVADTIPQTMERGEFQTAIAQRLVKKESIVALGAFIERTDLHRKSEDDTRLTIFDSSGVALQDCVVSQMAYDALRVSMKS